MCFVTMYHKGFRRTRNTKIIHQYLPREVGELTVWYMWLVLPFWQNVQGRIKQKRRRSAFLWADEVISAEGGRGSKRREAKAVTGGGEGDEGQQQKEEEAALIEKLEIVRDGVRIIREPTTRTNIRYRVDMVEDEGGRAAGAREGMKVGRRRGAVRIRRGRGGRERRRHRRAGMRDRSGMDGSTRTGQGNCVRGND